MKPSTGHSANISVITAAESVCSTRNTHFVVPLAVPTRRKVIDMLIITTCKDCLDRTVGCHGFCQKYLEAKSENERKKEWLYRKISAEKDFDEYRIKAIETVKRRRTH
jgi:hypothetical protein